MASLTDNPNAPNKWGTPIYEAAYNGHTEIIKILVPLTDSPIAPDKYGMTPFEVAKNEIIPTILKSLNTSRKHNDAEPSTKPSKKRVAGNSNPPIVDSRTAFQNTFLPHKKCKMFEDGFLDDISDDEFQSPPTLKKPKMFEDGFLDDISDGEF